MHSGQEIVIIVVPTQEPTMGKVYITVYTVTVSSQLQGNTEHYQHPWGQWKSPLGLDHWRG